MDLFDDLPEPVNDLTPSKEKSSGELMVKKAEKRSHPQDNTTPDIKVVKGELYTLHGHCVERKGEREEMQDAHTLLNSFYPLNPLGLSLSLYGVFDGHGGKRASNFLASKMHLAIAAKFPTNVSGLDKEMKKCMIDSFKLVDDAYLHEARKHIPSWKDGSTAVVVTYMEGVLYIANLGDSKAILCREDPETGKLVAVALTTDHHPTNYEERMRIQKAGGFVKDGRVMGVLEVSRSVGDGALKKHGVSCVPDVKRCSLTPHDKFLVIACDGLWKTFDNQTAVQFVNNILTDDEFKGTDYKTPQLVRLEVAANRVANEAVRRLSADNVTVMLVSISHHSSSHPPVNHPRKKEDEDGESRAGKYIKRHKEADNNTNQKDKSKSDDRDNLYNKYSDD